MHENTISLTQRINQANTRIKWICRRWYLGQMSDAQFEAERKEILDFIDEQSAVPDIDVELDADMHDMIMPRPRAAKNTGL